MQYSPGIDSTYSGYSRGAIVGDQALLPYTLSGIRRVIFLAIYVAVVASSFGGVFYSLYVNPVIAVFGLISAYILNNIAFSITHVRFHTSFIEMPESKMEVLLHNALIHHYRDVQIFHKKCLETRVSYFIDPKDGVLSSVFFSVFPGTLFFAGLLYLQHPILGITYFSTVWLAELLQSTIHEWYHNPIRNRKAFYTPVVYWMFMLLEKLGIASTRDHLQHHRHQLHNLNEVEKWLDLSIPFGEWLPTLIWKKALARYVPGEVRMTPFVMKIVYASYVLIHVSLTLGYLALYRLVG